MTELESLKPGSAARTAIRDRLPLRDELILAFVPTATVLIVFALVETMTNQRLLFASLASSAFLMIVVDAVHPPAAATALAFAFRTGDERNLFVFILALGLVVVLVLLQTVTLSLLTRLRR